MEKDLQNILQYLGLVDINKSQQNQNFSQPKGIGELSHSTKLR